MLFHICFQIIDKYTGLLSLRQTLLRFLLSVCLDHSLSELRKGHPHIAQDMLCINQLL